MDTLLHRVVIHRSLTDLTLHKGVLLHMMEESTAELPQAAALLENSCNPLRRFRAEEPNQEVFVLTHS